jgi:hypothetical protein
VTVAEPLRNSLSGRCGRSGLPSADTRQSRTCGQTPLRARSIMRSQSKWLPTFPYAILGFANRRPEIFGLTARIAGGNTIIRSLQIRSRENSPPPGRMRVGGERRPITLMGIDDRRHLLHRRYPKPAVEAGAPLLLAV